MLLLSPSLDAVVTRRGVTLLRGNTTVFRMATNEVERLLAALGRGNGAEGSDDDHDPA
jgi:hypothetical protein